MSKRNDGGPAFPRHLPKVEVSPDEAIDLIRRYSGMSLRDWFAGQALMGLMRHEKALEWNDAAIAYRAFHIADAMLAERDRDGDA